MLNTTIPVARLRRPPTRACTRRVAGARMMAKNPATTIQVMICTVISTTWTRMYVPSTTPTLAKIVFHGTSAHVWR